MILALGQLGVGDSEGLSALRRQGYRIADVCDLNARLLRSVQPHMVISALVGDEFDALDVARRLWRLRYPGPYRVLSPPLPDPDLVLAEIRAAAPGLDVDLLVVSHGSVAQG